MFQLDSIQQHILLKKITVFIKVLIKYLMILILLKYDKFINIYR